MSFFKRQDIGRVYVIKMVLPGNTVVHKIGMCHSDRAVDRMMEILKSWFTSFRFIPYTELRMDLECQDAPGVEKYIHKVLHKNQFIPTHKVSGHTEMFTGLDELRVIHFIKAYNNSVYRQSPELTDKECEVICQLISL